jgi:hypothetical protein
MPDPNSSSMPTLYQAFDRIIEVLGGIRQRIDWAIKTAENNYHRAQLLEAYKRRHSWKKSDNRHLMELGVNKSAKRRMKRLAGRGRPVVRPYLPLDQTLVTKFLALQALFDPATTPDRRKQALKVWPWWSHYVEALYRGEHALAKEQGVAGPSDHAEQLVGGALAISAAKVHSICGEIRRMRKEDSESANFPSMTLAEYQGWMITGKNPHLD